MIFPFEKKSIHQQDSGETMGNLYPVRGSDRDCVVFVKQVHFSYSEHQEHLIPLYYKADWDQLRRAMTDLADRMEPPKDSATNEEMWTLFRDTLPTAISDCIPYKQARVKESKPWISPTLGQLIKRGVHVFKKMRKQGTEELKVLCKQLQTEFQRQLQRAYWAYLNTTFEDADTEQATKNKRWLEPSQADAEILPDTYKVYRKDRNRHGGGVRGARATRGLRNVMGKAQTPRKRNPLHLHYRPDVAGEVTLSRFNVSLAQATAIPNAHVLTGGDLNFPSWDCKLMTLKPKPACPRLHHEFITMLND